MLLASAVIVSISVIGALAAGGHLISPYERIRHEQWILPLFALQALARGDLVSFPTVVTVQIWAVCGALLILLLTSQHGRGLKLIGVGIGINLFVVLANGAMPYRVPIEWQGLVASAGFEPSNFYASADTRHDFVILADVLPTPTYSLMSVGDVVMLVGVAVYCVTLVPGFKNSLAARNQRG